MFGIGLPELILILIVALLVVGPKKLPELARSLGKAIHDVKSMADDVKDTFVSDITLGSPDAEEGKAGSNTGEKPAASDEIKQDENGQSPEKLKSDPYRNLRG